MLIKPRQVPKELSMARSLNARMDLLKEEKWKLEKGFTGEVKFDSMADGMLQNKCCIINGLWLKSGDSAFQIDKLMIFLRKIYLIDVKNYEGDYHFDAEGRLKKGETFIRDPLNQLERAETFFRQLIHYYGYNFTIESFLVYINPEFTLYNAPQNHFVILPTQVNQFLKKLNMEYSKITEGHEKLTELLVSLDLVDSPYAKYPAYDFGHSRKGILCFLCHRLSTFLQGDKIVCKDCGAVEPVDTAVVRSVREIMMLFPETRITTNLVHEWCGIVESRRTIRRVMNQNFNSVGEKTYRYYICK
ncbi:nuclease-related domain-containing protein [Bacillus sp. FJAT-29814]|uniref:nuclease-related domain-containing protein n=1 Tax=Bacillus sp. FJAT-29814 TaxID=1729688 RepID=UPI00082B46AD|nr:nuclease-related domain-containing protein [Bacillus sp. FJAT-29814]